MVDIIAVGAGGGSLVDVDSGGLLRVGPRSAGADPGPVCYGRGGEQLTVTDANLIRGLIRPETFLGGHHRLDRAAAATAFESLATRLGCTSERAAEDVHRLACIEMASAIRIATTERGREVQRYTLVAYGGAGGLHAAAVADELGMPRVLVPPHPGLASAYGLLTAGFQRSYSRTHFVEATDEVDLTAVRQGLAREARSDLSAQGIDLGNAEFTFAVDMRYRGQGFEVTVDLPEGDDVRALLSRFHEVHRRRYGHAEQDRSAQLVTLRLTVTKPRPHTVLPRVGERSDRLAEERTIFEKGRPVLATFHHRSTLAVGCSLPGPAVIEEATSTLFVPSGWTATVDPHTNVLMQRSPIS